ncbi:MAG: sigma-70 family RNA polymerase sigma factor [Phycisphaera sp.]|nr:sigma-70 family RNA polymerase sigma factor [Phycisphaera sp.]
MSDAQAVDGQWIRDAVDRYERPLVLYASRMLHDEHRAADVVQDVFVRLCRQSKEDVDDHLQAWLFSVCRNRALDVIRKEKRMKPMTEHHLRNGTSESPDPADRAEDRDASSRVLDLVDDLPDKQAEVVRLKFQHGLSYREIAKVTEMSVSNVGYVLHTAIATLRQQMDPDLDRATTAQ